MQTKAWKTITKRVCNFEMRKGLTSFINPYSMLVMKLHPEIAEQIDYWHVDGISLINQFNIAGLKRFSFDDTSIAPYVFSFAKLHGLRVAIIGTKEEFLYSAVANIQEKHNLQISYFRHGYFNNNEEKQECYKTIIEKSIDLVVCGMGTPHQELFLIGLKNSGWDGYGFTCGGYLHQVSKKISYYPAIFDKLNIRWIYRIIDEPKLVSRYFYHYPKFFFDFYLYKRSKTHNGLEN